MHQLHQTALIQAHTCNSMTDYNIQMKLQRALRVNSSEPLPCFNTSYLTQAKSIANDREALSLHFSLRSPYTGHLCSIYQEADTMSTKL